MTFFVGQPNFWIPYHSSWRFELNSTMSILHLVDCGHHICFHKFLTISTNICKETAFFFCTRVVFLEHKYKIIHSFASSKKLSCYSLPLLLKNCHSSYLWLLSIYTSVETTILDHINPILTSNSSLHTNITAINSFASTL